MKQLLSGRPLKLEMLSCFNYKVIQCEPRSCKRWELTEEGLQIVENGSHEAIVFNNIPAEGIRQEDLMVV